MQYCRVRSVAEAVDELSHWGSNGRLLAGGTDVMPQVMRGQRSPAALIDISGIDGLGGVSEVGGMTSIGALVTMRQLASASLIAAGHPALAEAAEAVGAWQTQTVATVGGNICSAAPTADTLPALLVADAQLTLVSKSGRRRIALEEFLGQPGATALRPTEMLRAIELEPIGERCSEGYAKVGRRSAMDVAVVGLALRLEIAASGVIADARIAVCGGSRHPHRVSSAEAAILGTRLVDGRADCSEAGAELARVAAPESDGAAQYRIRVLPGLLQRLADRCVADIAGTVG